MITRAPHATEKLDSRARGLLDALARAGTQVVTRAALERAAVELLDHLTALGREQVVARALEMAGLAKRIRSEDEELDAAFATHKAAVTIRQLTGNGRSLAEVDRNGNAPAVSGASNLTTGGEHAGNGAREVHRGREAGDAALAEGQGHARDGRDVAGDERVPGERRVLRGDAGRQDRAGHAERRRGEGVRAREELLRGLHAGGVAGQDDTVGGLKNGPSREVEPAAEAAIPDVGGTNQPEAGAPKGSSTVPDATPQGEPAAPSPSAVDPGERPAAPPAAEACVFPLAGSGAPLWEEAEPVAAGNAPETPVVANRVANYTSAADTPSPLSEEIPNFENGGRASLAQDVAQHVARRPALYPLPPLRPHVELFQFPDGSWCFRGVGPLDYLLGMLQRAADSEPGRARP